MCLANSKKLGAYCIAGVDKESNEWLRPIGSGRHGAITPAEQTLDGGTRPVLLDVIELPLQEPIPQPGQPENWALATGRWRKVGELNDDEARTLVEGLATNEPVFGTVERSISVADVANGLVECSLAVIRPESLTWVKRVWPERTTIRAEFRHAGAWQSLPITDPAWLAHFVHDPPGDHRHADTEDVFLVVSLGEPMEDEHWKLVAGVICLPIGSDQ